jgi:uncharacterized RDD family membrane protein YckC
MDTGSYVTPRNALLTLHAVSDPSVEHPIRRGEPLRLVSQQPNGFVELEYGGQRWLAPASGLSEWTGTEPGPVTTRPAIEHRVAVPGTLYAGISVHPANGRPCFACGRDWGNGRSCQFCRAMTGLPVGVNVASPGKRLGGYIVEGLLFFLTLGIGWFVWSFIVYGKGQTPAKQLLGMRVVNVRTGRAASWGTMFLRELVLKLVVTYVAGIATFGLLLLVSDFWLLWDRDSQELWDKMLNTVVVNDPEKSLAPSSLARFAVA